MTKKAQNVQEGSRCKGIQGNTSKAEIKCVCLNARSIINQKNELNITIRVPVEGKSSVCDLYEILDNSFNYYHYQPGSNNIIVYGKHITHARMYARTHTNTRTHAHTRAHARIRPPPHRRHHPGCCCSMGRCAANHDEDTPSFRLFRWP